MLLLACTMAEVDGDCSDLGIPQHLHTGSRIPDGEFLADEILYRRYRPAGSDEAPPVEAFSTSRMSDNRSKFSSKLEDVLYDGCSGKHYLDWSIAKIPVNCLNEAEWQHPDQPIAYRLKVVHRPEKCMYPHSEVVVLQDGEEIDKVKPTTIKQKIRVFLRDKACQLK